MAARSSAGVIVSWAEAKTGEDVTYQVHQCKMLRDALLIAPSKEQPLGITASFAWHILGVHTNFREKIAAFWVLLLQCLRLRSG